MGQADLIQPVEKQIPLVGIFRLQPIVIVLPEAQAGDHGLLQRRSRAHREKIVDLFDALGDLLRRDGIAQPPAGDGIGLGKGAAADGPLPHPGQRAEIDVLEGSIDDMLIDLVGDHIGVVCFRQICNDLQLLPGKHLAAGVGGVAEDQRLGLLPEGLLQRAGIKMIVRRAQGDIDGLRPGKDGVGPVVFIKGRKDDDLVARIHHRHHGGHHGLRTAAGDGDLALRVDGIAHAGGLLGRQRLPEVFCAPGDGILVKILMGDLRQPLQDGLRRVKIRKALRKIDGAVLGGDPGHPADDGIGKDRSAAGKGLHWSVPPRM